MPMTPRPPASISKPSLPARLIGRLGVGKKLMLIYLLDLSAVIFISGILINEKYIAIDFARKELVGNAYIAVIRDALMVVATPVAPGADTTQILNHHAQELRQAQASHGDGMHSEEAATVFADSLAHGLASGAAGARIAAGAGDQPPGLAAGDLLTRGHDLLTRLGNQSNLILDPDLDSYYTMSLVLLRYPELLEIVTDTATRIGAPSLSGNALSDEDRTRFLILEGRLDAIAKGIASDYGEAFAAATPALRDALDPSRIRLLARIDDFRHAAHQIVESAPSPTRIDAVIQAQRALLVAIGDAWTQSGAELDRLLNERVHSLFARMWLHLGTALALLGILLTAVFFVARQIAVPLRRLAQVAETVRRTGDHSLRAHWASHDEIGRLVVAFNDMLEQLDRTRIVQQELVANARAGEAQKELVEATPIALVITSIPDHRVLHANQAALTWLNGRLSDPWSGGLDTGVRGRFFQRLADHDAVDEFEVNWRGGAEPAWAVLSARRLDYQGQDAVLTAFTPINQMKQMEKRLELWAKVFEASSESIMIMDARHCILTVNRAFSRSTLYEFHEVVASAPDFLFAEQQSGTVQGVLRGDFLDTLWKAADGRGSWQGEVRIRRRTGETFPAWLVVNVVRDALGDVSHYIGISLDISERKQNEERIRFLAHHDALTQLPNRSLAMERLAQSVQHAARSGLKVGVLFLDLDRFKNINDSLGHHAGDGLLRSVAQALLKGVRANDTVCRLGGDEFVVVLDSVVDSIEISTIIDRRLLPMIRQPHQIDGTEIRVSCSIGIAMYPDDGADIDTLMRNADVAMYQAKARGRNVAHFFTPDLNFLAQERVSLESSLRYAVERNELRLHYQPRIDAQSGALLGVEGLLRWQHPDAGLVLPERFISIAEESGLIVPIGAWVIEEACRQHAIWARIGMGNLSISINLSVIQLRSTGLQEHLEHCLRRYKMPPDRLELELTESILMDNVDTTLRQLESIKRLGVQLSIDDFGTGYSSLNYLNRFPIDKLKIDQSFVHAMLEDSTALLITKAIIGLGHTLGLRVVAEGVEQQDEANALRAANCDELQGYLFAMPMPAGELREWIDAKVELAE